MKPFVVVRHTLRASRGRVFRAFSERRSVGQWLSPSPDVAIEVLHFDFVEGGRFRLQYTMPDGSRPVVDGSYERIVRPAHLSFTWTWAPPDPHANVPTRVLVDFVEHEEAITEVVVRHEQLGSPSHRRRYADGWTATLERLEGYLASSRLAAPHPHQETT